MKLTNTIQFMKGMPVTGIPFLKGVLYEYQ